MVNFNRLPAKYWSDAMKASYLQRRIIVYSIMYYEFNESCISDREYDSISKQLVELKSRMPVKEYKRTQYYYCMYDFDGSTGFDLRSRLTKQDNEYLTNLASHILWRYNGGTIG